MKRWGALIAVGIVLALASGAAFMNWRNLNTPSYQDSYRERLASFDPVAYAKAAIAKRDFRHVEFQTHWRGTSTPGIQCIATLSGTRFGFDIVTRGDQKLQERLLAAMSKFNRTLVNDPAYPDKDICTAVDQPLGTPELAQLLDAPKLRPAATDLHSAVRAQDVAAVRKFIAGGADLNPIDRWGETPLIWSIKRRNREIFDTLILAGADPSTPGRIRSSPLIAATEAGDLDLARALLEAGKRKNPDMWHDHTNVPLIVAVENGRADIIRLLFEYGAVPVLDNMSHWEVQLGTAVRLGCAECLEAMFSLTGRALTESEIVAKLFREELRLRPLAELTKRFARAAADGLMRSKNERAPFLAAIENSHLSSVRLLSTFGHNVNLLDSDQTRTLTAAAARGDEAGMLAVLKVAAGRRAAINDAIEKHDTKRLRLLVRHRKALEQQNTFTPLMHAATAGNAEIVETLISLGAEPQ